MDDFPVWKPRLAVGSGILFLSLGAFIFGVTFTQAILKNLHGFAGSGLEGACDTNITST